MTLTHRYHTLVTHRSHNDCLVSFAACVLVARIHEDVCPCVFVCVCVHPTGRCTASEFVTFVQRVFEALFWDLQLFVSLVHSNCMLEGLTQMLLKGSV